MVWFEIIPSLVLTAGPLLLIAAPTIYIGNWYFLNGKVSIIVIIFLSIIIEMFYLFILEIWTEESDQR